MIAMPNYRVLVRGEGLSMNLDGRAQVCGFRVECHIWATDPAVAANMAAQVVRSAPALAAVGASSGAPVFIEEIDEAVAGETCEAISGFRFFPLGGDDDLRSYAFLER